MKNNKRSWRKTWGPAGTDYEGTNKGQERLAIKVGKGSACVEGHVMEAR